MQWTQETKQYGYVANQQASVYLAGPITGQSYEGATDWRKDVIEKLPPEISGFSPLRSKIYLLEETSIADSYEQIVMSSQRGIYARDHYDCQRCDAIFVNLLGAERVSIGTVMEIAWGVAYNKPIILAMEEDGNLHDHAMIREACPLTVRSIDEGIHILTSLLLPVPH
jgi:nucleoside 2-deoxyribosyltransferase